MAEIVWDGMSGQDRLGIVREAASKGDALTVYQGLNSMCYGFDGEENRTEARAVGVSDLESLWRAGRELDRQKGRRAA